MPRVVEAERSPEAPSPSYLVHLTVQRSRPLPATRTIAALLRIVAVGGAVVLATAATAATAAEPNAAGSAGWIATSPVPGARQGELTLVPHPSSQLYLTFNTQTPIEGHLHTADALSSPGVPIALRLFRSDPAEGLLMTWSDLFKVDADQTELDFEIAGQEPGTYRLLAYHALTEPLAVLDLAIVGETSTLPAPPPVPEGWQTVSSMSGDLVLRLPPDFGAAADWSSIVANPPPDGQGAWITVLVESPAGADLQPSPGTSLAAWLDERWFAGDNGEWSPPVTMAIRLPAGDGVWLTRTLIGGRPFSSTLYAIRTPDGVGFLVIDGPSDLVDVREADLELIPRLLSYP